MTREEVKKHWKEIHAFKAGLTIQTRIGGAWADTPNPSFLADEEYRIKPEPWRGWVVLDGSNQFFAFDNQEAAEECAVEMARKGISSRIVQVVECA